MGWKLPQRRTSGCDVVPRFCDDLDELLRGEVGDAPAWEGRDGRREQCGAVVRGPTQPRGGEVGELQGAAGGARDGSRRDVAVDDVAAVQLPHAVNELQHQLQLQRSEVVRVGSGRGRVGL